MQANDIDGWQTRDKGSNCLLRVTVLKGKGLRQMDALGENDPYVKVLVHMRSPEDIAGKEKDPDGLEVLHADAGGPEAMSNFENRTETLQEGGTAPEWGDDGYEMQFWVPEMPGCLELRSGPLVIHLLLCQSRKL